jgi:hypothetical protein
MPDDEVLERARGADVERLRNRGGQSGALRI